MELTVDDVRSAPTMATPLTMLDICAMSDGVTVAILASEEMAEKLAFRPVKIAGVGSGTDGMRMADRPRRGVILLPHESPEDYKDLRYPGAHSFRAAKMAYQMAGTSTPREELNFVELHDAYTSSEIQTYEDMGLCKYGEGGCFIEEGHSKLTGVVPANPFGGLPACGHPVGATGLMQAVFAFWQLQGTIAKHLGKR